MWGKFTSYNILNIVLIDNNNKLHKSGADLYCGRRLLQRAVRRRSGRFGRDLWRDPPLTHHSSIATFRPSPAQSLHVIGFSLGGFFFLRFFFPFPGNLTFRRRTYLTGIRPNSSSPVIIRLLQWHIYEGEIEGVNSFPHKPYIICKCVRTPNLRLLTLTG